MAWLRWAGLAAAGIAAMALAVVVAGRLGLLQGRPPTDLGVREGRLKPPSTTPNSVSSQAALYPDHPRRMQAQIAPLTYRGDPNAAMDRLAALVAATPGAQIVERRDGYLYATYTTPLMRFVDDVEFWLDPAGGAIELRSASRLGHGDRGLNRARIEALRLRFEAR